MHPQESIDPQSHLVVFASAGLASWHSVPKLIVWRLENRWFGRKWGTNLTYSRCASGRVVHIGIVSGLPLAIVLAGVADRDRHGEVSVRHFGKSRGIVRTLPQRIDWMRIQDEQDDPPENLLWATGLESEIPNG